MVLIATVAGAGGCGPGSSFTDTRRKGPTMATDHFRTRREDWATRVLVPIGVMIVMTAAVALTVAAVHTADTFSTATAAGELARDRAITAATTMWATPLALVGIATVFSGIVFTLARIRHSILGRRDALVVALPRVLSTTH
jgi:hypothetical protein